MTVSTRHRLATLCFLLCVGLRTATAAEGSEQTFSSPRSSSAGILFSDRLAHGLFLFSGSSVETISRMPGCGMYYTVSSDGKFAGYKEVQADGKQSAVVHNLEQNTAEVVQSPASRVGQISFADNGSIAFTEGNQLVVISAGKKQRYDLGTYANIAPISPDGRYVVYNDTEDQLILLELKSSVRRLISNNDGSYALPLWSPDGSQIVYSRLSGSLLVYSLQSDRTVNLGEGESPSWINNSTLVFVHTQIERQRVVASELWMINSDGTERRQMTNTPNCDEADPSYDRRTRTVVYADSRQSGLYARTISEGLQLSSEQRVISGDRSFLVQPRMNRSVIPSTPATPAAAYFAMPYVHQVWDTPDWYNGHWACGATSSIMVIAYYNLVPVWNVWCSASGSSPAHYSPYGKYICEKYTYREISYAYTASDPNGTSSAGGFGFMWTGSYSPYSRTVDYYVSHGMTAQRFDSSASFFSTVIANVDSGFPFTLCNGLTTAGHIIVVNGYDVNNRTLIVNDPYGNKNTGVYPSLNGKGVKYDWVGYNNGYRNLNRIYWGVSVRYHQQVRADSLVDDAHLNKGFYLHTAAPSSMTQWYDKRTGGYQNGHFWWTRTKTSDTCYALWTPELAKDGLYEVSAYIPYSDATKARYRIAASDSVYTVTVNQKPVKNNWLSLGTYSFAKGTSGSVRLGDGSDTTKQGLVFDAVKWTYVGERPLSVATVSSSPASFALQQNYPNPFNPETTIEFTLSQRSTTVLSITDLLGKEAARIAEGELEAGTHRYRLSAAEYGLSSGMYFYTLRAGSVSQTKRMIILK